MDSVSQGQPRFSKDQQLIIAAYELDVPKVKALLADGANPDARLGIYDQHLFENKWVLSHSPIGSDKWTPLLAVTGNHPAPQPANRTENTPDALEAAAKKLCEIDPKLIRERDRRRMEIARLLIEAKADLDLDDGRGTTALASATPGYEEVAILLITAGAEINTQNRIYIDGPYGITPLHYATKSPKILYAMLKRHPKLDVQDSNGETPLHWAARDHNVTSVKMLLAAGADPKVKDKNDNTPAYWCKTYRGDPDAATKEVIAQLLPPAPLTPDASRQLPATEIVAEEVRKLAGTWTVKMVTQDGQDRKKKGYDIAEFVFSADDVTIKWPKKVAKSKYRLNVHRQPKTIDLLTQENEPYSAAANGAYELNGDTLKLVLGPPDSYRSEISDKNQLLFILVRKKTVP